MSNTFFDDARDWASGRMWVFRALLLAFFAYTFAQHLKDPLYTGIFGGLNLGIHELGHYVFAGFGETMSIAGGSLLQCLVPLIAAVIFYRQRDYFGIAVALCWLSTNFFSVSAYAADARLQALPLVSPGSDEPIHDWHALLGSQGMLGKDRFFGRLFRGAAIVSMVTGLAFGVWLVKEMLKKRPEVPE